MAACFSAGLHPAVFGSLERSLGENIGQPVFDQWPDGMQVNTIAGAGCLRFKGGGSEQFSAESPEIIECILDTAVTLFGTITEPDYPFAAPAQVVGYFLERLAGNRCQSLVVALTQCLQEEIMPGVEQEIAGNRMGKIAIGLFDQQAIAEFAGIAEVRQIIFRVKYSGRKCTPGKRWGIPTIRNT